MVMQKHDCLGLQLPRFNPLYQHRPELRSTLVLTQTHANKQANSFSRGEGSGKEVEGTVQLVIANRFPVEGKTENSMVSKQLWVFPR